MANGYTKKFIAVFNVETGEEEYRLNTPSEFFSTTKNLYTGSDSYFFTRMGDLLLISPNAVHETSDRYILGEIIDGKPVFTEHLLPFEAEFLTSEIISEYMVAELPKDENSAEYIILDRDGNIVKKGAEERRVYPQFGFMNFELQISESGHVYVSDDVLVYTPYTFPKDSFKLRFMDDSPKMKSPKVRKTKYLKHPHFKASN